MSKLTNLEIVQADIRASYLYEEGVNPLDVVQITEVMEADPSMGSLPGDFWITDEVVGRLVRVAEGRVVQVWSNGEHRGVKDSEVPASCDEQP